MTISFYERLVSIFLSFYLSFYYSMSTTMPDIIQVIWNKNTLDQWFSSGETNKLHSNKYFNRKNGTIVLCIENSSIFGIAIIRSECYERCLLDQNVYFGDSCKYNKYECLIEFRKFANPILCSTISRMCGADPNKQSWYTHLSMRGCYLAGNKVSTEVRKQFQEIVMTWV